MRCKKFNKEDIIGKKMGYWIVLNWSHQKRWKHRKGHHKYKCKCVCGIIRNVDRGSLFYGTSTNCGCVVREKHKKELGHANASVLFHNYKHQARQRNIVFDLTREEFLNIVSKDCFYCGSSPSRITKTRGNGVYISNGTDRLDHRKGYTLSNCVPCCKKCNYAKHIMSVDEFYKHIKKIYKHMEVKSWQAPF